MKNHTIRTTVGNCLSAGILLSSLTLGAALISPAAVKADDDHHKKPHYKRYYDRERRDYHVWDDREDRSYRVYLQENHREYRVFPKVKPSEQTLYFTWRHNHPDD